MFDAEVASVTAADEGGPLPPSPHGTLRASCSNRQVERPLIVVAGVALANILVTVEVEPGCPLGRIPGL